MIRIPDSLLNAFIKPVTELIMGWLDTGRSRLVVNLAE
jgi:hypothetical protein